MKGNLFSRLFICFLISGLTMFLFLNIYGKNVISKKLIDDKVEFLYKEAHLIASEYMSSYYNHSLTSEDLTLQLRAIDTFIDVRIWIVDSSGVIVVDSSPTRNAKSININEVDPTFLERTVSQHNLFQSFFSGPTISVVQPVPYDYKISGYMALHLPLSVIDKEVNYYLDAINICFLLFLILLTAIFIYIYYITALPMRKLIKAATQYSHANYEYKLSRKGTSEYTLLADSLTYMAGELNSLDDYQKKFVANISHDFRSPLTSIKGYAEAILDGTIPPENQNKYLNIILFETERLNKLTSSLLELNSFENRRTFLNIASFDINAAIKKTAESFEGTYNERKISFNLVFSSKETYVDADMDKIQQVLYNLIDNAIKFSHSNSMIKISSEEKGEKVFISIKDYGVGIPKDSINKVWERFYKTDSSRGKDKKGTGLGLSITKEIIQAHNENINLISTVGIGTEFVFSLPKTEYL